MGGSPSADVYSVSDMAVGRKVTALMYPGWGWHSQLGAMSIKWVQLRSGIMSLKDSENEQFKYEIIEKIVSLEDTEEF